MACRILVPRLGIEPMPSALQGRFLTAGSPGKFCVFSLLMLLYSRMIIQFLDCLNFFFLFLSSCCPVLFSFFLSPLLYWSEVAQLCPTLYDPVDYSYQAPQYTELSRQEYWSGFPFKRKVNKLFTDQFFLVSPVVEIYSNSIFLILSDSYYHKSMPLIYLKHCGLIYIYITYL